MSETTIEAIRKRAQNILLAPASVTYPSSVAATSVRQVILDLLEALDAAERTIAERDEKIASLNRGLLQLTHDKLDRGALLSAKSAECERLRAETIEECAKLCDDEAKKRRERAQRPLLGDSMIRPFSQDMVQNSISITVHQLAHAIRALSPEKKS